MAAYDFNIAQFRTDFPEFSNSTTYTDAKLTRYWQQTQYFIANQNYGRLNGDARYFAMTLLTAHLLNLADRINVSETPGLVQSAGIDKVNLAFTQPDVADQFNWWLNLTGYGQELLALLKAKTVGGFYIGGSPQQLSFRGI